MEGIINFFKPQNMTSHDAVGFMRRMTGIRRIGHTGTLDPMAQGVLPICIGKATRLIEYLEGDKWYSAVMTLGMDSETQDIWGGDLHETPIDKMPSEEEVEHVLKSFEGPLIQCVPGFSAQKYNGKKLYEYARAGEDIPVKEKRVDIKQIIVNSYDKKKKEIKFDVHCSKGTYIRTICSDAGAKFHTTAVMSYLLRTEASGLDISGSVTKDEMEDEKSRSGNMDKYVQNAEEYLNLKNIIIDGSKADRFRSGIKIDADCEKARQYGIFFINDAGDKEFLGIGLGVMTGGNSQIQPKKVFPKR